MTAGSSSPLLRASAHSLTACVFLLLSTGDATAMKRAPNPPEKPKPFSAADPLGRYAVALSENGTHVLHRLSDGAPFFWLDMVARDATILDHGAQIALSTARGDRVVFPFPVGALSVPPRDAAKNATGVA